MSGHPGPDRRPLGCSGAAAILAAAVLWTVGLVTALQPPWLRLLLATAAISGIVALASGLAAGARRARVFGALAGGVGLGAAVFFPAVLFHKGDGAAAVTRRVSPPGARDLAARLPASGFVIVAGDLNAPSDGAAAGALAARGLVDAVPGGIDHVFAGVRGGPWAIDRAGWTLRPQDLARLIGEEVEISDHPGIVVDFVRADAEEDPRGP